MKYSKLAVPVIIFFIIANPMMYKMTGMIPVIGKLIADPAGRPTQFGVAVHAIVYAVIAHLMWKIIYSNK
jgi:hypothetical protein